MRCRTLTAAVDNGGNDDSRSTAHSAMARARRRRDSTPREDPAKGTDADRRGRRARFRRQVPRTTAEAGATGKTTLPTEGARKQWQWPVTGAGGTGKTTLPTEGAGRVEAELRPTTVEGEDQSVKAEGKGPPIATLVERWAVVQSLSLGLSWRMCSIKLLRRR